MPNAPTRPKPKFGGAQPGAGAPKKEIKKIRVAVYMPENTLGRLIDAVGNGHGAVSQEIVRIVEMYQSETKIV